jgi:hypothetical protein
MSLRICAGMILLWSAGIAAAAPPTPAPDIHVGDMWKYRVLDGFTHEPLREVTQRVVEINDHEIAVELRNDKNDKSALRYFNHEWNVLDTGEVKYDPYYPEYKFPMSAGMTWTGNYTYSGNDGALFSGFLTAKIAVLEKITVPAGTFDAYRIEADLETRSANTSYVVTKIQTTTWYAPAVRRFVKRQSVTSREGRVRDKSEEELIEYSSAAKPVPTGS